jgi:hypothetical protein
MPLRDRYSRRRVGTMPEVVRRVRSSELLLEGRWFQIGVELIAKGLKAV